MTIKHELTGLWARAAGDAKFRARLLKDPLAAAACLGIALNAGQVAVARDLHRQLAVSAQAAAPHPDASSTVTLPSQIPVPRLLPLVETS